MTRSDLIDLHHDLEIMGEERRRLGEYNADAKTILRLIDITTLLMEHIIDTTETKKK